MAAADEDTVKKALKINSFRELSKDKVLEWFSGFTELSEQVQLKVIEQIPEFKALATSAIDGMKSVFESTVDSNQKSLDRVHAAYEQWRASLIAELEKPDLSAEARLQIFDRIAETVREQAGQHAAHREFLDTWYGKTLAAVGAVSLGVIAIFATSRKGGGSV
ncbi:hypothetical protein [Protaetiibacter larvae]|uniref:Uncharacterized protein n=1 Tax=Protaetiibacter larvae TaxID=2592654 RepID=A0A5C1Y933_9MICO|nr:hypothetical protein [Protaetiibacter larvae]QEO09755.1 hypothetical protein FLP23_06900 [Protaetiibacter larvae]